MDANIDEAAVEAVARAMCDDDCNEWHKAPPERQAAYRQLARAAIVSYLAYVEGKG